MNENKTIYKETFRKSFKRLSQSIESYENDNDIAYIEAIAIDLRSLLCDSKNPYLIEYAKSINFPLYIFHGLLEKKQRDDVVFSVNFVPIGTRFMTKGRDNSTIEDFLNIIAFYTPKDTGEPENRITYKKLIKRICEKDGIAHLDEKPPQNYTFLKNIKSQSNGEEVASAFIRPLILNLGKWSQIVLNFFLSMMDVQTEIEEKLSEMSQHSECDPLTLPCLLDIVPYLTASLYFEGNCFGSTELKRNGQVHNGLCLLLLFKFLPQIKNEKKVIFECKDSTDFIFLQLYFENDLIIVINKVEYILLKSFKKSKYYNSFNVFSFNVHAKYFEFYINDQPLLKLSIDIKNFDLNKLSYAGSITKNYSVSCLIAEIVLIESFLAEQLIFEVSKFLLLRFLDFLKAKNIN